MKDLSNKNHDLASPPASGCCASNAYTNFSVNAFQPKGFNSPGRSRVGGGTYFDLLSVNGRDHFGVSGRIRRSLQSSVLSGRHHNSESRVSTGSRLQDYWIQASSYIPDVTSNSVNQISQAFGRTQHRGSWIHNIALITTRWKRAGTNVSKSRKQDPGRAGQFWNMPSAVVQGAGQNTADNNETRFCLEGLA